MMKPRRCWSLNLAQRLSRPSGSLRILLVVLAAWSLLSIGCKKETASTSEPAVTNASENPSQNPPTPQATDEPAPTKTAEPTP
ncbi:MAG: hypothetical protein VB862_07220, partial [Pirellulaceae bacterium]